MLKYIQISAFLFFVFVMADKYLEDAPKYTPKNLCIRFLTNNTALIQWVEPVTIRSEILGVYGEGAYRNLTYKIRDEFSGSPAPHHFRGYKIFYTTDSELPLHNWNAITIGSIPMTKINDMQLEETYTFRIQIQSLGLDGPEPISDNYNFKMLNRIRSCYDAQDTSEIKSLNILRATATSYNSVEVWWNFEYDPEQVTGFQVFYMFNDSIQWKHIIVGLTQSVELTNLEEDVVYKIAIAAITNSGLDHYSQEISVKVQPDEVPLDLRVNEITQNSIRLKWKEPPRFRPIKYKIAYDAVKDYIDSQGIKQRVRYEKVQLVINGYTSEYVIRQLAPFTKYNINITAVPVDYTYRPASKITVTTAMAAPPPMVKPDLYDYDTINSGNVQLILPQASEEYGPIKWYYVVVVPETGNQEMPSNFYTTEDLLEQDWEEAEDISTPYIAAKFTSKLPYAFILGSGEHGGFKNHKLDSRKTYKVFVRAAVATPTVELFTDSPYSDSITVNNIKTRNRSNQQNVIL